MLSDRSLTSVTQIARSYGDKAALVCGERRLSFVELDDRVGRLAAHLSTLGVGTGTIVSLFGPVGWEWVVSYHAILRTGATVNPINALLTADEVSFITNDCKSSIIVGSTDSLSRIEAVVPLPSIAFEDVESFSSGGELLAPVEVDHSSPSSICYTSGTTGRPKGAVLSHRAVLMNAGLTALMHGRTSNDIVVSGLPLAHVYGNVVMNSSILVGGTLVLLPQFRPALALSAITDHRATRFEGVPTMYYFMLEAPELGSADLSSLLMCTVGGQTMPVDKMAAVEARFGCPLVELWGMTEIAGLGTTFPWTGPRIHGSIGTALPTMQVRVVDGESGTHMPSNMPGELQIKGPTIMMGYLRAPEATAEVLSADGWLATGDIAVMNELGEVSVVDRKKDVILVSGNNVYPAELERVISSNISVAMVAVGRDTHPHKGEVPHAYVVLKAGAQISEEELFEYCKQSLAPYKLPRAVTFVPDLPRTSTGKILRRALGDSG